MSPREPPRSRRLPDPDHPMTAGSLPAATVIPPEETSDPAEERRPMSRRLFLELGLGTVAAAALLGGAGCGRARRIARGPRERTGGEEGGREHRRGPRDFGLGRLLRKVF